MMRHVKLLLVALLVVFSAAVDRRGRAEKVVRHRPQHSSRVSAGVAPSARATSKKRAAATEAGEHQREPHGREAPSTTKIDVR